MSGRLLANVALLLAVVTGLATAAEAQEKNADQTVVPVKQASPGSSSGKALAEVQDAVEVRRVAGRNPRVLFITAKDCKSCERELERLRRPGGDFEAMQARGWEIGDSSDSHLQIVDRDKIPDLVRQLNVREYPTVACISDAEIVRSFKDGCSTPLDAWTFGFLLKGQNERPEAPIPEPVRVASTGQYPLRGNHWSVEGDWNPTEATLVSHLRGSNHADQLATYWKIETWSYEELRSLHDELHENELGSATFTSSTGSALTSRGFEPAAASHKFFGR
jgi:hypothetical protein